MRMNRLTIIVTAAALALSLSAGGKDGVFLRQLNARDSVLIGDRLRYGAAVSDVEDGTQFGLPDMNERSGDSVTVLTGWRIDTLRTRRARRGQSVRRDIEMYVDLTSFEEGEHTLPALRIVRMIPGQSPDTLDFGSAGVEVRTMPVDTSAYVPHDIRGQVRYPLTAREIAPWLIALLLLALLVILVRRYILSRRGPGSGDAPDEPAHITALRKLEAFRGDRLWAPEKQKLFYSGVTDILREYISARYEFGAMEMTTGEIFAELGGKEVPAELFGEMKALFETSDFVKFAKMTLPEEDNARVLPQAIRFVTETWQEIIDSEAEDALRKKEDGKYVL